MFVKKSDISAMTGYLKHADQCRWLLARGYKMDVRDDGSPVLLVAEMHRALLGGDIKKTSKVEPRFDSIR